MEEQEKQHMKFKQENKSTNVDLFFYFTIKMNII